MDRIGAVLVDTYRIERLIAEGGMGAVYEASHLRIPKKFAVKFLKVSLLDNEVALLRFRREAEVIATLEHPSIVTLIDYNITEDGVPYTILEFLEGEHLGDRVSRGRMPLVDILRITEAVSGALINAHDRGIVHRDLKPENVILCTHGATKVVDFGIAKLRGAEQLTAFNSILGTITYMAPEQLTAGNVDGRSDQFALAAMVYEMLSGDMPFGSDGTIPEIADRVLRKQPAPIHGYPSGVFDVILRAMSKDAAQRYPSVRDFNDAFIAATRSLVEPAPDTNATTRDSEEPELPEMPSEATAIASTPTMISQPVLQSITEQTLAEPVAETTRITRAPTEPAAVTPKPRPEMITGRTDAIRHGSMARFSSRFGRRTGLIVGVGVGFALALVLVAILH